MESIDPYKAPTSDIGATPELHEYDQTGPLSPKGRFGRLSYIAWSGIFSFVAAIIAGLVTTSMVNSGLVQAGQIPPFSIAINLIAFGFIIPIIIRRFHDINASGWWFLTLLIPLVNLIPVFVLLLKRGSEENNQFGPPRQTRGWEKVLAIFFLVIWPIAIIAAIGIPVYQSYIEQAAQL